MVEARDSRHYLGHDLVSLRRHSQLGVQTPSTLQRDIVQRRPSSRSIQPARVPQWATYAKNTR